MFLIVACFFISDNEAMCLAQGHNNSSLLSINLSIISFSSPAPLGSVPRTSTEPNTTVSLDEDFSSITVSSAPDLTLLPTSGDTTVVIIVSVSLALLVCAIIPLIFCRHWRSAGGKVEDSDEHTDVPLTQTAVALQTDLDTDAPDEGQYASVYQALDPQSLD
ncbi:hypothetical protein WMY93_006561 [Mugilogobius chulae]|uniref:Uncharacterized protein n=1 Tax=Mugilogobius chulae TaxID=88201 RepID=A0AAW0PP17_9GOBI